MGREARHLREGILTERNGRQLPVKIEKKRHGDGLEKALDGEKAGLTFSPTLALIHYIALDKSFLYRKPPHCHQ